MALKAFKAGNNKVVKSDNRANKTIINFSKSNKLKNNKSKNLTYILNIKITKKPIFLTFNIKKIFNYLQQAFIKALIL